MILVKTKYVKSLTLRESLQESVDKWLDGVLVPA